MPQRPHSMMRAISTRLQRDGDASQEMLRHLLLLSRHGDPSVAETALNLILHPPVTDEITFHRKLIAFVHDHPPMRRRLPAPVKELLMDAMVIALSTVDASNATVSASTGRNFPVDLLAGCLCHRALPLQPLLSRISPRQATLLLKIRQSSMKMRFRLLRKAIRSHQDPGKCLEMCLTGRDLAPIHPRGRLPGRKFPSLGNWMRTGRNLLLQACDFWKTETRQRFEKLTHGAFTTCPVRRCEPMECLKKARDSGPPISWWAGKGPRTLQMVERLLRFQTEELAEIRSLAREVSRRTGRVVLSLHNASLAAAGGWAFDFLDSSFPSHSQWLEFLRATGDAAHPAGEPPREDVARIDRLWQFWERRLVIPQLVNAVWQSEVQAALNPSWTTKHARDREAAMAVTGHGVLSPWAETTCTSWQGTAVAPHQRRSVEEILAWRRERARLWHWGTSRLAAFIREGQRLLSSGMLQCFVIPWIDKFFISSRRDQDCDYLLLLLEWLNHVETTPVVLFWEDTSRQADPSFKLALERMKTVHPLLRGIGIFDTGNSTRGDALEIICSTHGSTELFALRPFNDAHNPHRLNQTLQSLDHRLFRPYDSAWKDNVSFLYSGTQILPLLSVQCEEEEFSPWVSVEHVRMPFGANIRRRLRGRLLVCDAAPGDPVAIRFARWANLL